MSENEGYKYFPLLKKIHMGVETKHYAFFICHGEYPLDFSKSIVYGENSNLSYSGRTSVHAEHRAIINLKKQKKLFKLPRFIDIIVIRLSKNGVIGDSKPCHHCLKKMNKFNTYTDKPLSIIKNVYYSIKDGFLKSEPFENLWKDKDHHHISSGYKKREKYL